jgi:hypothetical protein
MRKIIGVVVALSCAAPVVGAAPPAEPADNKVVCKRVDTETGSRMGSKRKCLTAAQWKEEEAHARRMLRHVDENGSRRPVIVEPSRGGGN